MPLPRVAITVGDPAGIGPEIAAAAAVDPRVREVCEPLIYAHPPELRVPVGVVSAEAGRAAYDAIVRAVEDARAGRVDAAATAPINKLAFARAGVGGARRASVCRPWVGRPYNQ
jgi:4-phospho-D-threonate 3-dehydrogenase / 4-phospho-D-erythronate 3-dehydrogenase